MIEELVSSFFRVLAGKDFIFLVVTKILVSLVLYQLAFFFFLECPCWFKGYVLSECYRDILGKCGVIAVMN